MPTENQLKIDIKVKNQQANKALKDVQKELDSVGKKADTVAKGGMSRMRVATSGLRRSMGALRNNLLLVSFAFGGTVAAVSKVIKAYGEQELAEKKLETALGRTSQSLLDQASALQKVTTFGDENIIQAQALIAAFVDDEEAIKSATEATLDLASAKGMDLFAAADLVAKTLGSTTNAMSRYGIEVTGAVGSTERLNSLTENIAKTFGGQAKAQADTLTGSLQQMSNAVGDAAEAMGSQLGGAVRVTAGAIQIMAEELTDLLTLHDRLVILSRQQGEVLTEEEAAVVNLEQSLEHLTKGDIVNKLSAMLGFGVLEVKKQLPALQAMYHDLSEGTVELDTSTLKLGDNFEHNAEMIKMLVQQYEFAATGIEPFRQLYLDFEKVQDKAFDNYNTEQELIAEFVKNHEHKAAALGLVTDEQKKQNEQTAKDREEAEKLAEAEKKAQKATITNAVAYVRSADDKKKAAQEMAQTALEGALQQVAVEQFLKAIKFIKLPPPWNVAVATALASTATASISNLLSGIKFAASGLDEVVTKPTLIMAGEAGPESVQITPLEGPKDEPQGGGGITVNVSGNVLSQDFVEGELAENIKDAIRRGIDFGIG